MLVPTIISPSPIPASGTGVSPAINTQGMTRGNVGLISDHAATLSVQRYVDAAGLIPVSTALTVALVSAVGNAVGWSDGLPCGSIIVSVINSAGAVANLTSVTVNLGP